MNSLAIACTMFGCVLASTLVAMMIGRLLPEHHLSDASRDVVKLGLGVVGTLTALVVGLLVSSTKGTFDTQSGTIKELAAQLAMVDRVLARYGPSAEPARKELHTLATAVLDQMSPTDPSTAVNFSGGKSRVPGETLFELIGGLEPTTDSQKLLKSRAQELVADMGQLRQRLVVNDGRSVPPILLIVLGIWQSVLFAGFGLLSPRNVTAAAVLVICMLSVSSAVFLVMELDHPFAGIVRISDAPLRTVITHLGE